MNQYANDFTSTVKIYYDDLKRCKPLSRASEKKLLKLCKKGNIKARNKIIEANLRFVFEVAKHYTGKGIPISDLISEGNMGLLKAIDKFDESKDVKFISYAVWWIRQSMSESIKRKHLLNFTEIPNQDSNDASIEEKLQNDEDDIEDGINFDNSNEEDEKQDELRKMQSKMINSLMDTLDRRERDVIENYFGINDKRETTLTDIGKKYNLTSERVRQIKNQGMKKLRSKILLYKEEE